MNGQDEEQGDNTMYNPIFDDNKIKISVEFPKSEPLFNPAQIEIKPLIKTEFFENKRVVPEILPLKTYAVGYRDGFSDGYKLGYCNGYNDGFNAGYRAAKRGL